MKWSSLILGTSVLALGLASGVASAAPITGHVGFSGSAIYDTRPDGGPCPVGGCPLATIDFYDETTGLPDAVPAGTGVVLKIGGADGYFSALNGNAVVRDLTNDPLDNPPSMEVQAGVDYGPAGVANFLSNFSDALDYPGLHFDITELLLQPGTTCTGGEGVGSTCVEGPLRLSQTATGFSIAFDVLGYFRQGADEGYYLGKFDMTIAGLTFGEVFTRLSAGQDIGCGASRTLACNIQANFDPATAVPEPATMLTFGAGSAILAAARRRRAAKANKA